jgi:hypothetical protein
MEWNGDKLIFQLPFVKVCPSKSGVKAWINRLYLDTGYPRNNYGFGAHLGGLRARLFIGEVLH